MNRLSGDQNGGPAPSVPRKGLASSEFISRTQRCGTPSVPKPTKASQRPSGDTLNRPAFVFSGSGIWKRIDSGVDEGVRQGAQNAITEMIANNAAAAHASQGL